MKRIIELTTNFKINTSVVINKYDLNTGITDQICEWCSDKKIKVIGKIPFDAAIVDAMINCKSIVEYRPSSETSKEIINIWKTINTN
jgi:MinD superfamily P-loop ATPase